MKIFQMPVSTHILPQSTGDRFVQWKEFLKNSKSNYVCLILCLHGYIDDGNLKFEGGNLTDWCSVDEVRGKTIFILPASCYNTNADLNPLKRCEYIRRFNSENSYSLRFRQIGSAVPEKRISIDGIETIQPCFEISRDFAIEVFTLWVDKHGLDKFYGEEARINLLYENDSRIINGELLGIKNHINAARDIIDGEFSIEGFNSTLGPEIKVKVKDIKFEIHMHLEISKDDTHVVLPNEFNGNRYPLIKRSTENRQKGEKCQPLKNS